ncbi:MAG: hypothetical protein KIS96_14520 [Bauldia sp.]|nr:hypothetical protein [Bauldia sp.]
MADTPFPFPRQTRQSPILVGNGSTGPYGPSAYKVFDIADVEVWVRHQNEAAFSKVAATVVKTGNAVYDTFSVIFLAALPASSQWYHQAARTHERQVAVTQAGAIAATELEKELSKQGTVLSELRRDFDRSWKADYGSGGRIAGAPGQVALFDANGNLTGGVVPDGSEVLPATPNGFLRRNADGTGTLGLSVPQVGEALNDEIRSRAAVSFAPLALPTGGGFAGQGNIYADIDYSHFNCVCALKNDAILETHIRGGAHGQRTEGAISTSQLATYADPYWVIEIDGVDASDGTVSLLNPLYIYVESTDDESHVDFLVPALDEYGVPRILTIPGPQKTNPNAPNYRRVRSSIPVSGITGRIKATGQPNGYIEVGTYSRKSNAEAGVSRDGGKSFVWTTLRDGMTNADWRCYWIVCGTTALGAAAVGYWAVPAADLGNPGTNYHQLTHDGTTWTEAVEITYEGLPADMAGLPPIQYTPWLIGASGWLHTIKFRGGRSWFMRSSPASEGRRWTVVSQIANCPDIGSQVIDAIDLVNNTFRVPGTTLALRLAPGDFVGASNASANNGVYRVAEVSVVGGKTVVRMVEPIPSATVAGRLRPMSFAEWGLTRISERDWLTVARVQGLVSSMVMFRTADGGATWQYLGTAGLPKSGGWISPWLETFRHGGRVWVGLILYERASASLPPPNARWLTMRVQEAAGLLDGTANFDVPAVRMIQDVSVTHKLSGYPGVYRLPGTAEMLVFMGRELDTANRAQLVAFRFNAGPHIPHGQWEPLGVQVASGASASIDFINLGAYENLRFEISDGAHTDAGNTFLAWRVSVNNGAGFITDAGGYVSGGGGGGTTSFAGAHPSAMANTAKLECVTEFLHFNDPTRKTAIIRRAGLQGATAGGGVVIGRRDVAEKNDAVRFQSNASLIAAGTRIEGWGQRRW